MTTNKKQEASRLFRIGNFADARSLLNDIRKTENPDSEVIQLLAAVNTQLGDFPAVEANCRDLIVQHPEHADAHYNLGLALQHQSKLSEALQCYRDTIQLNASHGQAHVNAGNMLFHTGNSKEAASYYKTALSINPELITFCSCLGQILLNDGRYEEAANHYQKVIQLNPSSAEPHYMRGISLGRLGKTEESQLSFRKCLSLQPDYAEAHFQIGSQLLNENQRSAAEGHLKSAIHYQPDYADAYIRMGSLLISERRYSDAIENFMAAIKIDPCYVIAHYYVGNALVSQNKHKDAAIWYRKAQSLARSNDAEIKANYALGGIKWHNNLGFTTKHKLMHDVEQIRYLISKRLIENSFEKTAQNYEKIIKQLPDAPKQRPLVPLSKQQILQIQDTYNKPIYIAETPALKDGALNKLDTDSIETAYAENKPGITHIDNILTSEALKQIRNFCMESTIFYAYDYRGYVGALMDENFNCDLLFQIADELRAALPGIFKDYKLEYCWAYKYDCQLEGIGTHADFAAVNVNFWITPDEANLDQESGGLVVYKDEAPDDWGFQKYNYDSNAIHEFLQKNNSESVTIPHRQNRAAIFNSDLFHETDNFNFKEGYENRRINITMLFGRREQESGVQTRTESTSTSSHR